MMGDPSRSGDMTTREGGGSCETTRDKVYLVMDASQWALCFLKNRVLVQNQQCGWGMTFVQPFLAAFRPLTLNPRCLG
jgi:hypothetical protein